MSFCGYENTRDLVCHEGIILIKRELQVHIIYWYQTYLVHLGRDRTIGTIKYNFIG